MRQSVYIRFAIFLIQQDVKREEALWRHQQRRVSVYLPVLSPHLMRDVGVESDGRIALSHLVHAERKVRHLRRTLRFRHNT
ncbi:MULTISPECIES: hypothetical protein [unclassified Photobacterium]|uniref:hypothetical protein n=1 Tax=unclassified Photobacterium TaxID=2628852 RepID=UPI000D163DBA|nr:MULTISPECIES: hypothetical protein [unclassified Photobacterium]PSV26007.1 hypothetical protein C9J42_13570 [Photobacterium sp. GB-56]PSV31051.1 hypothetical protein C9J40_10175 [Photobacterium sp. GB-72]PSV36919.1 hypothetical protein C9J44_08985 [Photobacterium sp. GB-27]PSV36997.1 hypothetical protein C9J38_11675 [Photobacterium sp. GB-210]PSV43991.1 hypothetical protein C9J46_10610 [Photobacterium sp. GB-36]